MSNDPIPGTEVVPLRADYGAGAYRRRIRVRAREGAIDADLEDDFHRFALRVEHDGALVTAVPAAARRYPWTTCPGAVGVLERLVGLPLTESHAAVRAYSNPRMHCTHLFDLATVAIACARRGDAGADYAVEVPDAGDGERVVRLARNGEPRLAWHLDEMRIVPPTPAPFAGVALLGGFGDWAEAELEPSDAEAALVLRRAVFIAVGRRFEFERIASASAFEETPAACHSFNPGVREQALRAHGMIRNFSDRPDDLLLDSLELQDGLEP
ncbi:MAG: DUF2889 domain-containing protein [Myxococcales bacterium]|nr:DUF2889 domain-containing protein [Myxococcales bacterium]